MGDVYMLNGKILSGLPNHAKDIEFDNTGTDMNSTNTEDAIKEVNSKLGFKVLAESTANTTYGNQLAQLKATYDTLTNEERVSTKIVRGDYMEVSHFIGSNRYCDALAVATQGQIGTYNITDCTLYQWYVDSAGTSHFISTTNNTNSSTLKLVRA